MKKSVQKIYLGDVVHKNAKNKSNIDRRKAKGYCIINEIIAITNEIPMAPCKVKAALQLKQAMLVNGVLINSEAWHNILDNDMVGVIIKFVTTPTQPQRNFKCSGVGYKNGCKYHSTQTQSISQLLL